MAGKPGHGGMWTDARVALMTDLWAAGQSAGDISRALGWVSRNAVIGKLYRLGLSLRSETVNRINKSNAGRAAGRNRKKPGKPFAPVSFKGPKSATLFKAEPYIAQPHIHVPEAERKAMADLEEHDCRWPFGDDPYTFCARRKVAGLPYCEGHARMAYQPQPPRRIPPITINATAEEITTEIRVRV